MFNIIITHNIALVFINTNLHNIINVYVYFFEKAFECLTSIIRIFVSIRKKYFKIVLCFVQNALKINFA